MGETFSELVVDWLKKNKPINTIRQVYPPPLLGGTSRRRREKILGILDFCDQISEGWGLLLFLLEGGRLTRGGDKPEELYESLPVQVSIFNNILLKA